MTDPVPLIEQARGRAATLGQCLPDGRLFDALADALVAALAALTRLANPTHEPKGEEAVLVQMEVVKIAREALAAVKE